MRGPEGRSVGAVRNVTLENITVDGPYEPYPIMPSSYFSYKDKDYYQIPWHFKPVEEGQERCGREDAWQITSGICGMPDHPLENITLKNESSSYQVTVETKVCTVVIRGKEEDLELIDPSQIRIVVDMGEITTVGTYSVPAKVYLDTSDSVGVVGEYSVVVSISR